MSMAQMSPFQYVDFYDVPRCIVLRHRGMLFLMQSAFDENLDDYSNSYSVYVLPESIGDLLQRGSWDFLKNTPMTCMGHIQIDHVMFDPSKRKELDATILDTLVPS